MININELILTHWFRCFEIHYAIFIRRAEAYICWLVFIFTTSWCSWILRNLSTFNPHPIHNQFSRITFSSSTYLASYINIFSGTLQFKYYKQSQRGKYLWSYELNGYRSLKELVLQLKGYAVTWGRKKGQNSSTMWIISRKLLQEKHYNDYNIMTDPFSSTVLKPVRDATREKLQSDPCKHKSSSVSCQKWTK